MDDANNLQEALFYRDTLDYKVDDEPQERKIQIQYNRGASGTEFIHIAQVYFFFQK